MTESAIPVEVIRSPRRRKTVQARLVDGVLKVAIPAHLSAEEEARFVRDMRERFARRQSTSRVDLRDRAARLARRHGLPAPAEITWSDRQQSRWGSCSVGAGRIRLSSRLAEWIHTRFNT